MSIPLHASQTFQIQSVVLAWGFCPIAVFFAYKSLIYNQKCTKFETFETLYRKKACIDHINFTKIEQGSHPCCGGEKVRKFRDFSDLWVGNHQIWTYQRKIWLNGPLHCAKFHVNLSNTSFLQDENPQNRDLNKFNTSSAGNNKSPHLHVNVKPVKVNMFS